MTKPRYAPDEVRTIPGYVGHEQRINPAESATFTDTPTGFRIEGGHDTNITREPVYIPQHQDTRVDLGNGNYISRGAGQTDASVDRMRVAAGMHSTPEQEADRAAQVAIVDQRRAATAAFDQANTPRQVGGMRQPDYSAAINQLIAQSSQTGDPNNFDSMLAARAQRHGAQSALQQIVGMRGQDITSQNEQARLAQAQSNAAADRVAGAGAGAQQQSNVDRAFMEQQAQNIDQAAIARGGQGLTAQTHADTIARQQYQDAEAAKAKALTAAQLEGQAQAYLTGQGMTRNKDGSYSTPSWGGWSTSSATPEQLSRLQAIRAGANFPNKAQ